MADNKLISIPVAPKMWAPPKRDYPITPRENLLRALDHRKPVWMPNFYASSQLYQSAVARDSPIERDRDTEDWFGVKYKYSAAQSSNTPQGNALSEIINWEKEVRWEDLSRYDWASDGGRLERDKSLALYMRMSNGLFERLHMIEGFEQALVDLITEPEAVRAFMERLVDFKIELFNRIRDYVPLDFIIAADDWGTMRAPFFSTKTFEETILGPTARFVKAVHDRGTKFVAHCCGVIDPFVPYMVEEIGFDALEIQALNDIPAILEKYGDRVSVEYGVNSQLTYDPDMTGERIRSHARDIVDKYGAHSVPGSGVLTHFSSGREEIYYALEDELYEYSKSRYEGERKGLFAGVPSYTQEATSPASGDKCRSFLKMPEPVRECDVLETVEADVVVVGAGLSGLCAALSAAEGGAKVVVIEKTKSWNVRGGHVGAANSKAWRKEGIVNDKKDLAREWIAACGNRAREDIVWLFVNRSEEAVDWLTDRQARHGVYPLLGAPRYAGPSYTERYGALLFAGGNKGGLQAVAENLCSDSKELGARYFFETPGIYLEKEGGRVSAVIGGKPGNYRRFRAKKAVILATGDIHGDKEMLEAYCPIFLKVRHSQYAPHGANTGDGHKMGLWAGGVMEDGPLPTVMHPQGYSRLQAFFLFVNVRGDRFMNEDTWCQAKSLNVLKQPGNADYAYSVFDSDWQRQMVDGMPYSGGLFNDNSLSVYGQPFTGEREAGLLESGLRNGLVVKADTIEELAKLLRIAPEKLRRTVDRYNEHADSRDDTDFGKRPELLFPIKKPPFYASKFGPAMLAVVGGLIVDDHLRVLDKDQDPIPGLYAAGNVSGGLYGVDYPTLISGNSHGRAVTWGYLAGRDAAREDRTGQ